MAINFAAQLKVDPSFTEPGLLVHYNQASQAFCVLPGSAPKTTLGTNDLYVYIRSLDLRSQSLASQFQPSFLPSASLIGSYGQTQTYNLLVRNEYGPDDTAAAAAYDVGLPSALDAAARQGINQGLRSMLLYGLIPENNEGLLNTAGATHVTLPPDSHGNTTIQTYDNGEMYLWLTANVAEILNGMYQSGQGSTVAVIGPQRILRQWELPGIIEVVQYQRPGAGTASIGEALKATAQAHGIDMVYGFDDTLIGKGAGGTDAVIVSMPEIDVPTIPGINTDEFGKVQPHINAVNLMYMDMAAPMKIPTPTPDGAITVVHKLRASCGWNVRPEGLYILDLPY